MTAKEIRATKIKLLKEMNQFILNTTDEETRWRWMLYFIPFDPDEEDFELIVDEPDYWEDTCKAFGEYTRIFWED